MPSPEQVGLERMGKIVAYPVNKGVSGIKAMGAMHPHALQAALRELAGTGKRVGADGASD
jgi:hypothetical protein